MVRLVAPCIFPYCSTRRDVVPGIPQRLIVGLAFNTLLECQDFNPKPGQSFAFLEVHDRDRAKCHSDEPPRAFHQWLASMPIAIDMSPECHDAGITDTPLQFILLLKLSSLYFYPLLLTFSTHLRYSSSLLSKLQFKATMPPTRRTKKNTSKAAQAPAAAATAALATENSPSSPAKTAKTAKTPKRTAAAPRKKRLLKPVCKGETDAYFKSSARNWDGDYHQKIGTSTTTITFGSEFVLTEYVAPANELPGLISPQSVITLRIFWCWIPGSTKRLQTSSSSITTSATTQQTMLSV